MSSYYRGRRSYPNSPNTRVEDAALVRIRSKLENGIIRLAYGDWGATFAQDILRKADRGQRLFSPKQASWVQKLADAQKPTPREQAAERVNVTGIIRLFDQAAQNLKYPKIRLQTASGAPVVFSRAGERSKSPGWINISDGGPFGANQWYGKIDPSTGEWHFPRHAPAQDVQAVVFELSEDPAAVAAKYGKLTGNCCFCIKNLTDERSLAVGYGAKCADNYNLPWGNKRRDVAPAVVHSTIIEDREQAIINISEGRCPDGCCGGGN